MQAFPNDPIEFLRITQTIFLTKVESLRFCRPVSRIVCRFRDLFALSKPSRERELSIVEINRGIRIERPVSR